MSKNTPLKPFYIDLLMKFHISRVTRRRNMTQGLCRLAIMPCKSLTGVSQQKNES